MLKWILAFLSLPLVRSTENLRQSHRSRRKLVLAIVIDQFRYDYLTRFRSGYTGGVEAPSGAWRGFFTKRPLRITSPTVTAIGTLYLF